jgi:hypothetical protein
VGPSVYLGEQVDNNLHTTHNTYTNLDDCITDSIYSIRSTLAGQKREINGSNKERLQDVLVPILFARIHTRLGKPKPKTIQILLDSGASASIFNLIYVNKLRLKHNKTTTWTTVAGNFTTKNSKSTVHYARIIR